MGNSLKVEAVLLEPVERELEAHWRGDLLSAQGSFDHFRQMVKRVELQVPEVPLEDAIKAYRKTVDELVSNHGLRRHFVFKIVRHDRDTAIGGKQVV